MAHEALLTAWPRLARWLEDDAAGRAVRRHLAPAAREWEAGGRPDDELYRGARLTAALDWADSAGAEIDARSSSSSWRRRRRGRRRRADRRPATCRPRGDGAAADAAAGGGLAAVLVVALVATFLAVRAQRETQQALLVADANRLAALSTTAGTLDLSLLLAAQAVRLAGTPEAQDGLLAALTEQGRAERVVGVRRRSGRDEPRRRRPRRDLLGRPTRCTWGRSAPSSPSRHRVDFPNWESWGPSPLRHPPRRCCSAAGERQRASPGCARSPTDGSTRRLAEGAGHRRVPLAAAFSAGRSPGAPARRRVRTATRRTWDALERQGHRRGGRTRA